MSATKKMFKRMTELSNTVDATIQEMDAVGEISGEAFSAPVSTLADAPLAAEGMVTYAFRFISNGRKIGEGVGAGTGVLAWYDPATDSWLRASDETAVVA